MIEVLTLVDRFVGGWPKSDDSRAKLSRVEEVLTTKYPSDAHFAAYSCDVVRRHTNASLDRADEAAITMVLAVFDVDGPGHEASVDWQTSALADLERAHPGGFVYRTRGGYRIVYALPEPWLMQDADDASNWSRRYVAWCSYLERNFGIVADRTCKNWTRLFRAPHVTREGVMQELPTQGDPTSLGIWSPALTAADCTEPEPNDRASEAPDVAAPVVRRRESAAELLAKHWPARGRHSAQMALAGALCRDGWSESSALEFLCDVCRLAGDEDRPKRMATVRDTYKSFAQGRNVSGWSTLQSHVDTGIVGAARALLDGDADARAEFVAAMAGPEPVPPAVPASDVQWGGWDKPQAPPVYLLEGIIPEAKVVTFFAEGGSVKSWSALALAISVATGEPWLGAHPVKQGKALYLDYEDGPYEFHRRVRYLTGGQDIPTLGYRYGGAQIDSTDFWINLASYATEHSIELVVIDSISASMPGDADENASQFVAGMKLAGRFTETGCSVLFVHHANKSGGIRGFSGIRDQSDVVFKFESVSETDDVKRMRMICDKPGPQKKPPPVNVELNDHGLTTFEDEVHAAGRNAVSAPDICDSIRLTLASSVTKTGAEISKALGKRKQTITAALGELEAAGEVVKLADGYALDDDDRRKARVLALLSSGLQVATAGEVARHAHVSTLFVDRLRLEGIICRSGDGRWMRVEK